MWPFNRQSKKDTASTHGDPTLPATTTVAQEEAHRLSTNMSDTAHVLEDIGPSSVTVVKDLITETKTFSNRLEALIADLDAGVNLDQISGDVDDAYNRLKNTVGQSPDINIRRFFIGTAPKIPALIVFEDGLADNQMIDQDTILVAQEYEKASKLTRDPDRMHQIVHDSVVTIGHATMETSWSKLYVKLMGGNTILFVEGSHEVLVLDTVKYPARALTTPSTERAVKGPQEAFNEVVLTQMNLVRTRIKSPLLHFDLITMGELTSTDVIVAHIEGLTNPELVAAVKRKLSSGKISSLHLSEQLVPLLASHPSSLFPQVRSTERVDVVARELTMGKVCIMVDNNPFALMVPNTLMDFYQTLEDYTMSFWSATVERIIRFLGLFLGLLLPPLYIALTSVNPELLPTKLIITVAGSRVGLPLPPIFEVLTMWIIIEVLREAAIRLPKQLSTTLGTVGAIVVGTAVVKAGIVSPLMIVIITLTALGLYTSPSYEMAVPWRVLFWLLVTLSYFFGLYGIILGLVGILGHLASLENFGVPYLSPFGPYRWRDLKDSIMRFPDSALTKRPTYLRTLHPRKSSNWNADPMLHPQLHQAQVERIGHVE